MNVRAATLSILGAGLFACMPADGQSQTVRQPKFSFEIQAAGDQGPTFTLTNLSAKTLTACFLEISSSSENGKPSGLEWDALWLGQPLLEPGASISQNLPHRVGGPLPDKLEIAAGVWEDGETFGRDDLVKLILANRAMRESEYDQAVSLLQQGLDGNWTADQYLAALNSKPETGSTRMIRSNLDANKNSNANPQVLQHVIQRLLEYFSQKRGILRQAKPHQSLTSSRP